MLSLNIINLKKNLIKDKFNQNITNIQLDDMFTMGLKEFKEIDKKTNSAVEALVKNKRTIVQYIIAILLQSTLVDIQSEQD